MVLISLTIIFDVTAISLSADINIGVLGLNKIAQQVKELTTKPANLSSVLETHKFSSDHHKSIYIYMQIIYVYKQMHVTQNINTFSESTT